MQLATKAETCDYCLTGNHIRCSQKGTCGCSVCRMHRPKVAPMRPVRRSIEDEAKVVKIKPEPRPKELTQRGIAQRKYGVRTDFTDEEIEQIFEQKAAGIYISEIARTMGSTRDRIRTIYNLPQAPEFGCRRVEPEPYMVKGGPVTGNDHLDKAKALIDAVKDIVGNMTPDELFEAKDVHRLYLHHIDLASIQANVAQAEALTRIAAALERH